jgi:Ca2+-binding RTX toxin-like protein
MPEFGTIVNGILPPTGSDSPHITSGYGVPRASGPHGGIDMNYLGGQSGINLTHPNVHAPVGGTVTFVGGQYGTVKITDANGYSHQILHLHTQSVSVGQTITAGTVIGTMGGRGPSGANAYAQHVHYQLKDPKGRRADPEEYWEGDPPVDGPPGEPEDSRDPGGGDRDPGGGAPGGNGRNFGNGGPQEPLIIDLDGDGLSLIPLADSRAFFDLDQDGYAEWTGWAGPGEGLLSIDIDENGRIDDSSELFGTSTTSGFTVLAQLDSNSDGLINASDADFGDLRVWIDANGNGFTNEGELSTLAEAGITQISLTTATLTETIEGHDVTAEAVVTMTGAVETAIYEVWLDNDRAYSLVNDPDWTIAGDDLLVPSFHGAGTVADLPIATSEDATLQTLVLSLLDTSADLLSSTGLASFREDVEDVLVQWTGSSSVNPTSRGSYVNAVHLAVLEKLYGASYGVTLLNSSQAAEVESAYERMVDTYTLRFVISHPESPFVSIWLASETDNLKGSLDELVEELDLYRPTDPLLVPAFEDWARAIVRMYVYDVDITTSDVGVWVSGASATGSTADDLVTGTAGADTLSGGGSGDVIVGGDGNDTIDAGSGYDAIHGGLGNDSINGGTGSDYFLYDAGDGDDTITDYGGGGGDDALVLGDAFSPDDVRMAPRAADTDDIVVTFANATGSVTLNEKAASYDYGVNEIRFADGTIWYEADILSVFVAQQATAAADTIHGTYAADVMVAGAGNDTIYGKEGQDIITGGLGDDVIDGGDQTDTFIYDIGDGNDRIFDYGAGGAIDTLEFGAGITLSMLRFDVSATDSDDVVITFDGQSGSIVLDEKAKSDDYGPNRIRFADASLMSEAQLLAAFVAGQQSGSGETIHGTYLGDTIEGGGGNDNIYGKAGGDRISGGAGDDVIDGGDQTDIFVYALGDGNDRIFDYGTGGAVDTLELGAGITPAMLLFSTSATDSDDIIIAFAGYAGTVTLDEKAASDDYGPNAVSFDDATIWSEAQLLAYYVAGLATGAADTIQGSYAADTIAAGAGDDNVYGRGGNDIVQVGASGGYDAVDGGSGTDTITATAASTVIGLRSLVSVETISAVGYASVSIEGSGNADTLNFSSVTLTDITHVDGGGGNDTLTGNTAANTFWGGSGDDVLRGNAGNDALDGGIGSDKAVFAGNRSTYTITTSGGSVQIVDNAPTTDGNDGTDTLGAVEQAQFKDQIVNLAAPIVLDLDGDGVELVDLARSKAAFDFNGDGLRDRTGWVGKGDGLLVLDRDGDGTVSGAAELSFVDDRAGARSDLDGLRAHDDNGDGLLSALDPRFGDFLVWMDRNRDGEAKPNELLGLKALGIAALDLGGRPTERAWAWGENVVVNNSAFIRDDGSRSDLADVVLIYEPLAREVYWEDVHVFARSASWGREALPSQPDIP